MKKTTFRVSETDYNFVFPTSEVLLGVDIGILHQELTEFRQFGNLYNFESNWVFPIPYFICFLPQFENKILIFFSIFVKEQAVKSVEGVKVIRNLKHLETLALQITIFSKWFLIEVTK